MDGIPKLRAVYPHPTNAFLMLDSKRFIHLDFGCPRSVLEEGLTRMKKAPTW